jgi:predicted phosphoribosyltransferase
MLNWLKRSKDEYDPMNDEKFVDRAHAGKELAQALREYAGQNALVLGIPRGGLEPAWWVKTYLKAQWSVLIANKLHLPDNEEFGIGAIAEDGSEYIDPSAYSHVNDLHISTMKSLMQLEVKRRVSVYRKAAPIPNMEGRPVILVDDGIAMGSTMRVAIDLCRKRNAGKVVVAAPIGPKRVVGELQTLADEVVVLRVPMEFRNIRQGYEKLYHLTDEDVWAITSRKQATAPQHKPETVPPQEPGNTSDPSLNS